MYSNNSNSIRDALCFFMDEKQDNRIAYVQYPQAFYNLTRNDIYGGSLNVEVAGIDANGGPCYIGTGCFHRREILCGRKFSKEHKVNWRRVNKSKVEESLKEIKEACEVLASCTYEKNTEWGKEMGLKYGCLVEDMITGLAIQCRGWRSVYVNPQRKAFLGLAPTTLLQTLAQQKRWSEGDFQIFLSRNCPLLHGHKKIPLMLQLSYCIYFLWPVNCLATLYYVTVPSLCLLRGIPLFPKASSPWFQPFAYAFFANRAYGLVEFIWSGGTIQGWWNDQRMWMFKRVTSYLFGFSDNILKLLGFRNSSFIITEKVASEDVSQRYGKEIMEFGSPSPMFTILATLALLNLFTFLGGIKMVILKPQNEALDIFALQMVLCGLLISINLPVYEGLFFRKDNGRIPSSVTLESILIAVLACLTVVY